MKTYEVIAEGLAFPEGPVVMADGSVIVVEIRGGRITRCWEGRKETICEPGDGPNGAAIGPDGALYVCNSGGLSHYGPAKEARIERVDLGTGRVERLYESCDGELLSAPNDLIFDCDGYMWFTDNGRTVGRSKEFGGLYRAKPDGTEVLRIKDHALSYNGVGLSPDMSTVYVADTYTARVYAFERRGEPQEPRLVGTVPGQVMLDSLAMTAAGNICVAAVTGYAIATVNPDGSVGLTPCEDRLVTNIAFGGADMRDAWLTYSERGALVKTRWDEPGLPLVYNG